MKIESEMNVRSDELKETFEEFKKKNTEKGTGKQKQRLSRKQWRG